MTYVVTEACIHCKYMDCVEVCPVDCFYEGENMLVIHPDECIDCGVCEPECPAEAILPDTEGDGREVAGAEPPILAAPGPTSPASARRPTMPTSTRARPDKFEKYLQPGARRRHLSGRRHRGSLPQRHAATIRHPRARKGAASRCFVTLAICHILC